MKYFLKTNYLEGFKKPPILFSKRNKQPTIDLISISMVGEDGREYYAISKDFNLKEAWDRYSVKPTSSAKKYLGFHTEKVYSFRKELLLPIYWDLIHKENPIRCDEEFGNYDNFEGYILRNGINKFYGHLKGLVKKFGKTNSEIAKDIMRFIGTKETIANWNEVKDKLNTHIYGYNCSFDWVVFCWLFNSMGGLPEGFPSYCRDLKQTFDERTKDLSVDRNIPYIDLTQHSHFPPQPNTHTALSDARWNKGLDIFLNNI